MDGTEQEEALLQEQDEVREALLSEEKADRKKSEEEDLKKEEERREKMKVLLSGYLELKAKKEIEKASLNEKKIIAQWLYPFRAAYQREWQLELTKLRLAFQKALDYKKSHVHAIQRERKLTELNHLWADSAHYQVSEELFDFMRMRCDKLKQRYLEELEETKEYYLEREKRILDKCTKGEERAKVLETMRNSMHENILKQSKDALEEFRAEGEFLREKEMDLIRKKHTTYVEQIAHELQTSISPPEHRMEEVRGIFDEWKQKHESFIQLFAKNRKDLQAANEAIPPLQKQVESARKQLDDLKKESKLRKQIQTEEIMHLQTISRRCERLSPHLRKVISESEEVLVELRERKVKLDKIIQLKKFCDDLETEQDRTISIDEESNEDNGSGTEEILKFVREVGSSNVEDQNLLKVLYRKLSSVKFQNAVIVRDIEKLKIENMALKCDMKKYLKNISSGDWQQVPENFQFVVGNTRKMSTSRVEKPRSHEQRVKQNLELLNQKCKSVNQKINKVLTN